VHVAGFDLATTAPRIAQLPRGLSLARWCAESGVDDALVGGFFTRPENIPLGELRIGGEALDSVQFDHPWGPLRACLHIARHRVRIASRAAIEPEPIGDLLQAGPLLVEGGHPSVIDGADPEGFSAGSRQFDSDITVGRYPRAALGLTGSRLLAVACEGRAADEAGLTLPELAATMVEFGAETAINLDGGGSTSLVLGGTLVNRPREEHGIEIVAGRPIATGIAFQSERFRGQATQRAIADTLEGGAGNSFRMCN
jgi:hypothetical protein